VQRGPEQLRPLRLLLLSAALAAGAQLAQAEPRLTRLAQIELRVEQPWFGGLSGLEVAPDGRSLWMVTDRGYLLSAPLRRGASGQGLRLGPVTAHRLKDGTGKRLPRLDRDAEGLAIAPDGTAYISFEHHHRVARVNLATGRTHPLPSDPAFESFAENAGLEALATDAAGRPLALSETPKGASLPIHRFKGGAWQLLGSLPRRGAFLPVGADMGPDGRLYLLERTLSPLGFRSRIRRFDPADPAGTEETLWSTFPGQRDNLEGLTAWRDGAGRTRLILVSDDNFFALQRTELLELLVEE
jgi:hypothetical protein